MRKEVFWLIGAGAVAVGAMAGCSASGNDTPNGGPVGGGGAGATDSGAIFGGGTGGDGIIGLGAASGAGGPSIDGGNCGSVSIDTSVEEVVTPGNVLIIFDQSDSMSTADFNGQVRWVAASDAVYKAIDASKDLLTVGAVFFPSVASLFTLFGPCDMTSVSAINDTASPNPQIPFMPGPQFLGAWVQHWNRNPLTLGTPIDAGMQRGDEALTGAQLKGKTVVIFATDGQPTCTSGTLTTDLPTKWAAAGIPTYVVGLPGAGAQVLQTIATAGGTAPYLTPADSGQLQQMLSTITATIVKRTLNSCDITFNAKPADPNKVVLVVTEGSTGTKFRVGPGADGWTLAPDGSKATLNGATCTDATGGRFSNVSFAFGCVDAPLLR